MRCYRTVSSVGPSTSCGWPSMHIGSCWRPSCRRIPFGLIKRRPPGFERIDDEITCLGGTAKGDVELTTIFRHNPTWDVLFFQPHVVITCLMITPRAAAAGYFSQSNGR